MKCAASTRACKSSCCKCHRESARPPCRSVESSCNSEQAGLTGTRHACSWAGFLALLTQFGHLSASFLGKRMSFLLGGAWERPGSVLTGGEARPSPARGEPEILLSWGFPPRTRGGRGETQAWCPSSLRHPFPAGWLPPRAHPGDSGAPLLAPSVRDPPKSPRHIQRLQMHGPGWGSC